MKRFLIAAAVIFIASSALAQETKSTTEAAKVDLSSKVFKIEITGAELDLIGAAIKAAVNVNTGLQLIPIYNKLLDQARKQIADAAKGKEPVAEEDKGKDTGAK